MTVATNIMAGGGERRGCFISVSQKLLCCTLFEYVYAMANVAVAVCACQDRNTPEHQCVLPCFLHLSINLGSRKLKCYLG